MTLNPYMFHKKFKKLVVEVNQNKIITESINGINVDNPIFYTVLIRSVGCRG